jgi:HTH-type transcriptional regulator/antitoxin HipB
MDYAARTPEQLGQILRGSRKRRGLTQQAAASKVGLKQATVSAIENDASAASVSTLYKLLSALGLELVVRDSTVARATPSPPREW